MLTLQKNRLSPSQKLFIVFAASFMPFVLAIVYQLDILAALEAALLVFFSSAFFLYRSKHKNAFRLD